ncbi:MAG TPA: Hsp70 family protein, partial [Urbifossiella sp.]|nr:Hsp70 family protein [Urbifossiella sp.]
SVGAKDLGTGKQQTIRIEGSSGLSKDEVEKMKRDAELHADEDKRKRELADVKNEAEGKIHQIEKAIADAGDKVSEADKAPVTKAVEKVREALKGGDPAAVKAATAELDQVAAAMAQHLYSAGAGSPPPGATTPGGPGPKPGGDDVMDAEYEVKK